MEDINQDYLNNLKSKRRYIYIIVVLITLMFFREGCHKISEDNLIAKISEYSDSSKVYKTKYGYQVFYNKTLQFNSEKQLKLYLSNNDTLKRMLKNFKNIGSVTTIKSQIEIHDTVPVYFDREIPCDFAPITVRKDSIHFKYRGTIYNDRFTLDTLIIPNKQDIVIGYKKISLFKREQTVEVVNSNPYVNISNIGSYTVKHKKEWYERPIVHFATGLVIGYGAAQFQSFYIKN